MTSTSIRALRDQTGETQKEFANRYHIPLSTLKKWEQGNASPAPYVLELIADSMPLNCRNFQKIGQRGKEQFYYDKASYLVSDGFGNVIRIREDPGKVDPRNLNLYLHDLFQALYAAQDRFDRDCRLDQEEGILWSEE